MESADCTDVSAAEIEMASVSQLGSADRITPAWRLEQMEQQTEPVSSRTGRPLVSMRVRVRTFVAASRSKE